MFLQTLDGNIVYDVNRVTRVTGLAMFPNVKKLLSQPSKRVEEVKRRWRRRGLGSPLDILEASAE